VVEGIFSTTNPVRSLCLHHIPKTVYGLGPSGLLESCAVLCLLLLIELTSQRERGRAVVCSGSMEGQMVVRSPMVDYIAPWLRARGCLPAVSYWGFFCAVWVDLLWRRGVRRWIGSKPLIQFIYFTLALSSFLWLQLWLAEVRLHLVESTVSSRGQDFCCADVRSLVILVALGVTTFSFIPHGFRCL
jgi:hypothetical protein